MVNRLERELVEHRASLTHLDATMRLFDPTVGRKRSDPGSREPTIPGSVRVSVCV